MVDQTDGGVQRELGAIGAKIDGLTSEIRYRFDDVASEVAKVKADSDHGIRNVRTTIQALDSKVEKLERKDVETTAERKTERKITWGVLSAIGAALVALATAVVSHDGLHL